MKRDFAEYRDKPLERENKKYTAKSMVKNERIERAHHTRRYIVHLLQNAIACYAIIRWRCINVCCVSILCTIHVSYIQHICRCTHIYKIQIDILHNTHTHHITYVHRIAYRIKSVRIRLWIFRFTKYLLYMEIAFKSIEV